MWLKDSSVSSQDISAKQRMAVVPVVYHRSLFLTIRDKFRLSYLIFAASTV